MIGAAAAVDIKKYLLFKQAQERKSASTFSNPNILLEDDSEKVADQLKLQIFEGQTFGNNPGVYKALIDGDRLDTKQQIGALLAGTGSTSPILPIITNPSLSKNEDLIKTMAMSGAFVGYPGSTGTTQRLVPFLTGEYSEQEKTTVPLILLAGGATAGNAGLVEEVIDIFLDETDEVTEKDLALVRALRGEDPGYVANPWMMTRYLDMDDEGKPITAKDLLESSFLQGTSLTGVNARNIYDLLDKNVAITGDNLDFYTDLAAGKYSADMIYDYLEDKDVITGKILDNVAAMLGVSNGFLSSMFDDDEVLTLEDFERWAIMAGYKTDPMYLATMKNKDKIKALTPVEFFEAAGILGDDAADFFLDTKDTLTAEDYMKALELRGTVDPTTKFFFERMFDDDEEMTASKLQEFNVMYRGTLPSDISVFQTVMDDDSPLTKDNIDVYEAVVKGTTVSSGKVTDFIQDNKLTGKNYILTSAATGRPINYLAASVVDEDEEITGKDYLKMQTLSGRGSTFLASQLSDYKGPLSTKDYVTLDRIATGGTAAGSLSDQFSELYDLGAITREDLALAAMTNVLKGSDSPSLSKQVIPAFALRGKLDEDDLDIVDATLPWLMTSGRSDYLGANVADILGDDVTTDSIAAWTAAGTLGAKPTIRPATTRPAPIYRPITTPSTVVRRPISTFGSRPVSVAPVYSGYRP